MLTVGKQPQLLAIAVMYCFIENIIFLSLASFPHHIRCVCAKYSKCIHTMDITYKTEKTQKHAIHNIHSFHQTAWHCVCLYAHCVLCNRINILNPLYLCTGMKCTQTQMHLNEIKVPALYLRFTSIIIIYRRHHCVSSFVNESLFLCFSVSVWV